MEDNISIVSAKFISVNEIVLPISCFAQRSSLILPSNNIKHTKMIFYDENNNFYYLNL